jgi:hypothetical protein
MSASDTAKEVIRIATTAGLSKDVIDLQAAKLHILVEENAELSTKVSRLEIENRQLRTQLENFQPFAKPADICPYCRRATGQLIEIKPSTNPHWGDLGFKAARVMIKSLKIDRWRFKSPELTAVDACRSAVVVPATN